ncbi:MAG TPA: transcription termination/antitermination protein NusA [Bacteroidales bacterium]|nr:transcription termination/antitermination protein NusA [Bacteroidales bacterium]
MENLNLIDTFSEFKEIKNIDRPTMMVVLEDVFRGMLIKMYGTDENFDIIVNIDKGDLEIWRNRIIVPDDQVKDKNREIGITDANLIDTDYELGEEVTDEVKFSDFGRRAILAIRQNLTSRILELSKEQTYNYYKDKVGDLITCEVYQVRKKEAYVLDDNQNELVLPYEQQIPGDILRKGEPVLTVVQSVELKNNQVIVMLSRTSNTFLEKLFEREIPEVFDGLITIKRIARIPGERAKVAVESYDERVDPVGACVGQKGSRIHGIVRELRNENIDVINYSNNLQLFIARSLSPAQISEMKINETTKKVQVFLRPEEVSRAIGKGGSNIKLAGQLTGYEIDVYRNILEEDEDVDLEEFSDEIEDWVIDALKAVGCDTAKSVLRLTVSELEKRTDLEVETIEDVLRTLQTEFE